MNLKKYISGTTIAQSGYRSFRPTTVNHEWTWDESELNVLLEKAGEAIGSLNSYSILIPNVDVYIRLHIRTEAHKSNKIEGTKTTIEEDLMNIDDVPFEKREDRIEVENYIHAINEGIHKISIEGFPLSSRLIRELHYTLLQGVRGERKTPGEFRRSQNWIGGSMPSNAVFVPPFHDEVPDLISDLEKFIHNDEIHVPDLVKIAIIHYQFETIHPFLDGNGRIGRLIIPLFLLSKSKLLKPCFYISNYFELNKSLYYDKLTAVRTKNEMTEWIKFFLQAIIHTAESAKSKFEKIVKLVEEYKQLEYDIPGKNKNIASILNCFYHDPILSINEIVEQTDLTRTPVSNIVKSLVRRGVLYELPGYNRNRLYVLKDYFQIFASE